jgi:hypothetical protein
VAVPEPTPVPVEEKKKEVKEKKVSRKRQKRAANQELKEKTDLVHAISSGLRS